MHLSRGVLRLIVAAALCGPAVLAYNRSLYVINLAITSPQDSVGGIITADNNGGGAAV